jgi:hypothetical protein
MTNDAGFPSVSRESKNGSLTVALAGIWGINVTSFVQLRRYSNQPRCMTQCHIAQYRAGPAAALLFSTRLFRNTLFNVSEGGTS